MGNGQSSLVCCCTAPHSPTTPSFNDLDADTGFDLSGVAPPPDSGKLPSMITSLDSPSGRTLRCGTRAGTDGAQVALLCSPGSSTAANHNDHVYSGNRLLDGRRASAHSSAVRGSSRWFEPPPSSAVCKRTCGQGGCRSDGPSTISPSSVGNRTELSRGATNSGDGGGCGSVRQSPGAPPHGFSEKLIFASGGQMRSVQTLVELRTRRQFDSAVPAGASGSHAGAANVSESNASNRRQRWRLVYTSNVHGFSHAALQQRCQLVIRDVSITLPPRTIAAAAGAAAPSREGAETNADTLPGASSAEGEPPPAGSVRVPTVLLIETDAVVWVKADAAASRLSTTDRADTSAAASDIASDRKSRRQALGETPLFDGLHEEEDKAALEKGRKAYHICIGMFLNSTLDTKAKQYYTRKEAFLFSFCVPVREALPQAQHYEQQQGSSHVAAPPLTSFPHTTCVATPPPHPGNHHGSMLPFSNLPVDSSSASKLQRLSPTQPHSPSADSDCSQAYQPNVDSEGGEDNDEADAATAESCLHTGRGCSGRHKHSPTSPLVHNAGDTSRRIAGGGAETANTMLVSSFTSVSATTTTHQGTADVRLCSGNDGPPRSWSPQQRQQDKQPRWHLQQLRDARTGSSSAVVERAGGAHHLPGNAAGSANSLTLASVSSMEANDEMDAWEAGSVSGWECLLASSTSSSCCRAAVAAGVKQTSAGARQLAKDTNGSDVGECAFQSQSLATSLSTTTDNFSDSSSHSSSSSSLWKSSGADGGGTTKSPRVRTLGRHFPTQPASSSANSKDKWASYRNQGEPRITTVAHPAPRGPPDHESVLSMTSTASGTCNGNAFSLPYRRAVNHMRFTEGELLRIKPLFHKPSKRSTRHRGKKKLCVLTSEDGTVLVWLGDTRKHPALIISDDCRRVTSRTQLPLLGDAHIIRKLMKSCPLQCSDGNGCFDSGASSATHQVSTVVGAVDGSSTMRAGETRAKMTTVGEEDLTMMSTIHSAAQQHLTERQQQQPPRLERDRAGSDMHQSCRTSKVTPVEAPSPPARGSSEASLRSTAAASRRQRGRVPKMIDDIFSFAGPWSKSRKSCTNSRAGGHRQWDVSSLRGGKSSEKARKSRKFDFSASVVKMQVCTLSGLL